MLESTYFLLWSDEGRGEMFCWGCKKLKASYVMLLQGTAAGVARLITGRPRNPADPTRSPGVGCHAGTGTPRTPASTPAAAPRSAKTRTRYTHIPPSLSLPYSAFPFRSLEGTLHCYVVIYLYMYFEIYTLFIFIHRQGQLKLGEAQYHFRGGRGALFHSGKWFLNYSYMETHQCNEYCSREWLSQEFLFSLFQLFFMFPIYKLY